MDGCGDGNGNNSSSNNAVVTKLPYCRFERMDYFKVGLNITAKNIRLWEIRYCASEGRKADSVYKCKILIFSSLRSLYYQTSCCPLSRSFKGRCPLFLKFHFYIHQIKNRAWPRHDLKRWVELSLFLESGQIVWRYYYYYYIPMPLTASTWLHGWLAFSLATKCRLDTYFIVETIGS